MAGRHHYSNLFIEMMTSYDSTICKTLVCWIYSQISREIYRMFQIWSTFLLFWNILKKSLLISTLVGHDTAWGIPYIFYTLIYNNGHLIICQTIRNIVTHPLISHLSRSNPLWMAWPMVVSIRSTYLITWGANVSRICWWNFPFFKLSTRKTI